MRQKRRFNKNYEDDLSAKKLLYISGIIVVITIITFIITYIIYSKFYSDNMDIADISDITKTNIVLSSEASNPIGRTVKEVENANNKVEKIAINTSNIIANDNDKKEKINEESRDDTVKVSSNKVEEKVADPIFIKPVEGEIIREFANESLVYSETLKEWITHTGIDIKADRTTIVKASSDGVIKAIKNDPRYGITVIIEHANGYTSVYSNLLTAEFVKEKEQIKSGQTIGTIGDTAVFEILDEPHLHFEILKDNEYLNPEDYIKY